MPEAEAQGRGGVIVRLNIWLTWLLGQELGAAAVNQAKPEELCIIQIMDIDVATGKQTADKS